ncbi:hypothetical protein VCHENC02_2853B, partial [Vibrio harveyi]
GEKLGVTVLLSVLI